MKREDGLELKGVERCTVGRGVREADRVLRDKPNDESRNSSIDSTERRACLPRTLASALRGCGREHEGRPNPHQESGFLPVGPRQNREIENRQIAELGSSSASRARYGYQ